MEVSIKSQGTFATWTQPDVLLTVLLLPGLVYRVLKKFFEGLQMIGRNTYTQINKFSVTFKLNERYDPADNFPSDLLPSGIQFGC